MDKLQNKFIALILLITLGIFLLLSLSTNSKKPPEKIIIADAQLPVFALIYIADKKGYFKQEGIDVSYRKFSLGKDALLDVVKGNSDLATVFETPIVRMLSEGEKLSIITTLHTSTRNTGLVGLKSHGIFKPSDLKNKKIAVTKGINAEFFLYSLLTTEGISQSEVEVINMTADQAVKALQAGSIDAAALYNPYLYIAQHASNADDITSIYSDTYTEISMLAGKKGTVSVNSNKMKKLLRALVKAEIFISKNENEAINIVDQWLPQYTEREIRKQWYIFTPKLVLNNLLLLIMTREAQFFFDIGIFQNNIPNVRDAIDTTYLKEIKPEGITIY